MGKMLLAAIAVAGITTGAQAADWTFGLGVADYMAGTGETHVAFEARAEPFATVLDTEFAPKVGVMSNVSGSYYVGTGLALLTGLGPDWFIESGLMVGYYDAANQATDLGSEIEFHSIFGIGRRIGADTSLSVAASHLSNAGIDGYNPGVNMYSVRLTRSF